MERTNGEQGPIDEVARCPYSICKKGICGRSNFLNHVIGEHPHVSKRVAQHILENENIHLEECLQPEILEETVKKFKESFGLEE